MAIVDPRLVAATREQFAERDRLLATGAQHVGWKLGMGERESIGGHIVVGYLTSATSLDPGASFAGQKGADLHVDVEAYVEMAGHRPDAIGAYGLALELVDLTPREGEPDSVVAMNIWHRAVSFSTSAPAEPRGTEVGLRVNGELRRTGTWPDDITRRLRAAHEVLEAVGSGLRAGDRIITGSIVQGPAAPGDSVSAVIGDDEAVTLRIE